MEKETKTKLARIIAAAALLAAAMVTEHCCPGLPLWALLLIYLVPYLVAGLDVLAEGLEGIAHGRFNEDFLMSVATVGALCIGFLPQAQHQLSEAVFVMLFFQVGELFEHLAQGRSRRSIGQLMDLRPDTAHVERNGQLITVAPEDLRPGDTIVIEAGEKVPVDGVVTQGESALNTVALTGESVPRSVSKGDDVLSGCVNQGGVLHVRVAQTYGDSTAARVLSLVENASSHKSRSESFVARFARIYTPIVVAGALLVALVPPLLEPASYGAGLAKWLYRALTFLVVSCPCALVISVPLTFFGGIGGASRRGILVKGGNYLEALARLGVVVMDKTGTLTRGTFTVTAVHPHDMGREELLHLAAHAERFSTHPIAVSLRNAFPGEHDHCDVQPIAEVAGQGVLTLVNGHRVAVGNAALMDAESAAWHLCEQCRKQGGTIVHIAVDGSYAGHVMISDTLKSDAAQAVAQMKRQGVQKVVMLTGDHEPVAQAVAQATGIDEYHAQLLPADKVAQVERLEREKPQGCTLAMVGDGINDAPVLARADVGIAMGGLGSDAAIEAADVVLMDDHPTKIATGMAIARRTLRIARENVVFSIGVKVAVLALAAFGLVGMGWAVFADVGVMVLAVLNATRTLHH